MKREVILFGLLIPGVCALSEVGCSNFHDTRAAKGTGYARIYDASFETVWESTKIAIAHTRLAIATESKEEGYIQAYRGVTAFSWGENVSVFISKVDATRTRVEVVSMKVDEMNILARDWELPILNKVTELIVKKP